MVCLRRNRPNGYQKVLAYVRGQRSHENSHCNFIQNPKNFDGQQDAGNQLNTVSMGSCAGPFADRNSLLAQLAIALLFFTQREK